jgi:hypothetical protein
MTRNAISQTTQTQLDAMQDRLDFARKLQILTNRIHATDNVWQIMLDLSTEICDLFQCERLTLYVVNKEQNALVSKVKTGIDSDKDLVLPIDRRSIGGFVALTRGTVRIDKLDDPAELSMIDPELRFFGEIDRATGFHSKQMLAAPLLQGISKELVGVLQLINQKHDGRFDCVAEEGLEALTVTLAQAIFQRIKTAAMLPKRYEVLAAHGVISTPELDLAQRWAQRKDKDLEWVLVEDFKVPLVAIGSAMAKEADLPYQALETTWRPNLELAKKVSRALCLQHHWLPFSLEQNMLTVVTTEPGNRLGNETIHRTFPYNEIRIRYTTRTEFSRMLAACFPAT